MGPASPEHGELVESAWKHDERMNGYKMVIHIQVVKQSECVCLWWRGVFESVKRDDPNRMRSMLFRKRVVDIALLQVWIR